MTALLEPTIAGSPRPWSSHSPAACAAWDFAKQSIRMAVFAQYDNARAMHAGTADAAVRVVQSLSGAR
jgi:hypothetical protein